MKNHLLYRLTIMILVVLLSSCGQSGLDMLKLLSAGNRLTEGDIINGLKEALNVGTDNAIEQVSKKNGYFNNPKIKIPLPETFQNIEKVARVTGMGEVFDEFEQSMNRAAEAAAPKAGNIFFNAIKDMTFYDGKQILYGNDNEATLYFKDKTYEELQELFRPIVHNTMSQVGATAIYQGIYDKVKLIPFTGIKSFDLDQYVTDYALNGLFLMLEEEEMKIRTDPKARITELLKKVFGSVKN